MSWQIKKMGESGGPNSGGIETALKEQTQRIRAALAEARTLDASPIIQNDECLSCEEYIRLVYELHHVHFPELERQGLIEFDRQNDRVTRGPRFDETRSLPSDEENR